MRKYDKNGNIHHEKILEGIRLQKQLQHLMKGHALMNGRTEVNEEDYQFILELSDYINFKFNKI